MDSIQNFEQPKEQYQVIKPALKTSLILLHSFSMTFIIFLVVIWILLGPIVSVIMSIFGDAGVWMGISFFFVLFFIILIVSYFLKKASLKRTEYRFYSNRVEYFEGFLVKNRKTVNYDRVSNIGQVKGVIEGLFGLGTIFIDTAGSSPKGHEVAISYLENPDQVYDWISKMISKK
jgi:membrane protein YdbS with pleckstrin-like domain